MFPPFIYRSSHTHVHSVRYLVPSVRRGLLFRARSYTGLFVSLSRLLSLFSYLLLFPFLLLHFSLCLCPSLWSSPLVGPVEGGRSRGRQGMLILPAQRQATKKKKKKRKQSRRENVTRLRKWDGHYSVGVCVSAEKIRVTVWVTFCIFFQLFARLPCRVNDICVYIGVRFCLQGANANGCMHVSLNICFLPPSRRPVPYPFFCFSSQSHVSLTFSPSRPPPQPLLMSEM